jgi:fumarate hydratase subunit alpha
MDNRLIEDNIIESAVVELIRRAITTLPADVVKALDSATEKESGEIARRELRLILENVKEAKACLLPMCQDTGVPMFFVKMGFPVAGFEDAVARGVRHATGEVPLRSNVVNPLTRRNTGDNTGHLMPYISYSYANSDHIEIQYLPKGAGSENMSALAMLTPSQGVEGIKKFVLQTVVNAEGKPCPPVIVGVGIGGTSDVCMSLAKKSLLRKAGSHSTDPMVAALEDDLLHAINATGIGPMGLGGDTTALAVHIECADCHTASLPVGVNLQCYAARRALVRIYKDGKVEFEGI